MYRQLVPGEVQQLIWRARKINVDGREHAGASKRAKARIVAGTRDREEADQHQNDYHPKHKTIPPGGLFPPNVGKAAAGG